MATASIHPEYWTRQQWVQMELDRQVRRAGRRERRAERRQQAAWMQGMNEDMRNHFLEQQHHNSTEDGKEQESCEKVPPTSTPSHANEMADILYWKAPIIEVDEDELFEMRTGMKRPPGLALPN